jgi:hypothetical protein
MRKKRLNYLTLRLTDGEKADLHAKCREAGLSSSELVRRAIQAFTRKSRTRAPNQASSFQTMSPDLADER